MGGGGGQTSRIFGGACLNMPAMYGTISQEGPHLQVFHIQLKPHSDFGKKNLESDG